MDRDLADCKDDEEREREEKNHYLSTEETAETITEILGTSCPVLGNLAWLGMVGTETIRKQQAPNL